MNRLVVVADMGRVRAFRLEKDSFQKERRWHASELEVPPLEEVPAKIREEVSDQAGEFSRGNAPGMEQGMSRGEEHNYELEHEKRLIQGLAGHISQIVLREEPEIWELAAPQAICKRLEAELDSGAREHLKKVESADLTKAPLKEIEERFAPPGPF